MTREEVIKWLKIELHIWESDCKSNHPIKDAIRAAIKALEQEPCEDCISRQEVKKQMVKYGFHAPDVTVTEFIEDLPPVTPQPKCHAHWIHSKETPDFREHWTCSHCNHDIIENPKFKNRVTGESLNFEWCPYCGEKIEGSEE